jgi:hypothetical protein
MENLDTTTTSSSTSTDLNHHNYHSTDTNTDDVLYVLGVAGLASKKLLQKHHLTTTATSPSLTAVSANTDNTESTTSNAVTERNKVNAIDVDVTRTTSAAAVVFAMTQPQRVVTETVVQTVTGILARRKDWIQYQSQQLKQLVTLLLVRGPIRMLSYLWKYSGGKRTIQRMIGTSITLSFFLARTVSYLLTSDSTA